VGPQELDVSTVGLDLSVGAFLDVLLATEGGEAPVLGDDDLLAAREPGAIANVSAKRGPFGAGNTLEEDELVLASPQSLESSGAVRVAGADRQQDLADVDTGDRAIRLSPRATHACLQPIGPGARQHLVDADDVEGVGTVSSGSLSLPLIREGHIPDPQMETILSGELDEILVGRDAGRLESLRRQLLVLVRHQMDAQREVVDAGTLASEIEDLDLGVRDSAVEPGLGVGLVCSRESATVSLVLLPASVFLPRISLRDCNPSSSSSSSSSSFVANEKTKTGS